MATINEISMFTAAAIPNNEFITEVTDSVLRRRNEVAFVSLVDGLPGDPEFGLQLSDQVGELLDAEFVREQRKDIETKVLDLCSNIKVNAVVVGLLPGNQFVGVDIQCTDLESGQDVMTPLAVRKG